MDHFVVSARKYRPATFNTVVGQDSITTTLKNAIKSKHLAQAFLFCGPRGVGKTTCARILAKTINCTNLSNDTEGCNTCESCVSFNNGQSLNIFELDAASNNSVDDMRNLVEQVRYPPQSGNFKIYIIDEVHMLSTQAFNAFLKTLEEPPAYAIFILATTEKHKIIPTILSRCQIFDFNRITIDDIAKHLQWIASSENVNAEPEALHLIAQKADGALRDALSIFDQIVSFAGNTVTYKHVIDNLNILDYEYYFKITDHLVSGDFPSALLLLNEIINDGFDVHHFINGLNSHFRDLLVCKDEQTIQLLEVSSKTKEKYKAQSQQCSVEILFRFLETGNRCDIEFKAAQNQRLLTELALLKMCSFHKDAFSSHPATATLTEKKTPVIKSEITSETLTPAPKMKEQEIKNTVLAAEIPAIEKPVTTQKQELSPKSDSEVTPKNDPLTPPVTRSRPSGAGTTSIS
ncbi:MAG TPA: DNA polymerase III subunit gamma/tau, partial [Bacteroidia bacterium]|nr:DNA polymerase III subunit gamma/tau [Bacteroidia bacterium]